MIPKYLKQSGNNFKDYFSDHEKQSLNVFAFNNYSKIRSLIANVIQVISKPQKSDKPEENEANSAFIQKEINEFFFGELSKIASNFINVLFKIPFISQFSKVLKVLPAYEGNSKQSTSQTIDHYTQIKIIPKSFEYTPQQLLQSVDQGNSPHTDNNNNNSNSNENHAKSSQLKDSFSFYCLLDFFIAFIENYKYSNYRAVTSSASSSSDSNLNNKPLQLIFNLIPELRSSLKNITYPEILSSISAFADSNLLFINVFKTNYSESLISGIIFLPYTPDLVLSNVLPLEFLLIIAKFLSLKLDYLTISEVKDNCSSKNIHNHNHEICKGKVDLISRILKQKLLDVFYFVQDNEELHGVTFCHSCSVNCKEKASLFCENYMCKHCCQNTNKGRFCLLHHKKVNYFRHQAKSIFEFELSMNFNIQNTLRITSPDFSANKNSHSTHHSGGNNSVTGDKFQEVEYSSLSAKILSLKSILIELFSAYSIDADYINKNLIVYFSSLSKRIEAVYFICPSNTEAQRIYEDKENIVRKQKSFDINISHLLLPIPKLISDFNNKSSHNKYFMNELEQFSNNNSNAKNQHFLVENSGLLVFPMLPINNNEESGGLPKKMERQKVFQQFIEYKLNLQANEYSIVNCKNNINNNHSYSYFIVCFNSNFNLNRFYYSQPFFNCVVFHKFCHLSIFPLIGLEEEKHFHSFLIQSQKKFSSRSSSSINNSNLKSFSIKQEPLYEIRICVNCSKKSLKLWENNSKNEMTIDDDNRKKLASASLFNCPLCFSDAQVVDEFCVFSLCFACCAVQSVVNNSLVRAIKSNVNCQCLKYYSEKTVNSNRIIKDDDDQRSADMRLVNGKNCRIKNTNNNLNNLNNLSNQHMTTTSPDLLNLKILNKYDNSKVNINSLNTLIVEDNEDTYFPKLEKFINKEKFFKGEEFSETINCHNNQISPDNRIVSALCVNCQTNTNDNHCPSSLCCECCLKQFNNNNCKVHIEKPWFIKNMFKETAFNEFIELKEKAINAAAAAVANLNAKKQSPQTQNQNNQSEKLEAIVAAEEEEVNSDQEAIKESLFEKYNKSIFGFDSYYSNQKLLMIIEINEKLKNSDFSFFRAISNNNFNRLIKDMNKELIVVMDNQNYRRENYMKSDDRMYKCYAFQNYLVDKYLFNNPQQDSSILRVLKGFDFKGDYFFDVKFKSHLKASSIGSSKLKQLDNYELLNEECFSSISNTQYDNLKAKFNEEFDLIICGLEAQSLSAPELVDEVFQELKSKDLRIGKENVLLLNENSIINMLYEVSSKEFFSLNFLSILQKGRFILVKFDSILDALRVYLGKKKINLPLVGNVRGIPVMIPSSALEQEAIRNNIH